MTLKKSTAAKKVPAKQAATNLPPPGAQTGPGSRSRRRTRPPAIDAADDQTTAEELTDQRGEGGETHQTAADRADAAHDATGRPGGRRPEHVASGRAGALAAR